MKGDAVGRGSFPRQVEERFGLLPNFFCSAQAAPGLIEKLWAFAEPAYLDNPLPSLFKERLFVHLSRFCEVRYCIVRHVGFLMGQGRPAGDASAKPLTLDQTLRLLRRPVPDAATLRRDLQNLGSCVEPCGLPALETENEARLFDALTMMFLVPTRSAWACEAVRKLVGERHFELLTAFLAFVRTAHYWTETHPELSYEPDMLACMERHPELAALLLDTTEAVDVSPVAQLRNAATDLDRVEGALRQSEERLRGFGNASQDVLWIRDAKTLAWTYLTPAFEQIYGVSREEALKGDDFHNWLELVVPEDRTHARAMIDRVMAGERLDFEYRIRRPQDGSIRWLRDTDFPIRDEQGRVVCVGGIGQDITSIKVAAEELRTNEERLRIAAEVARFALWDWNVETGEVAWSDEHFRMEGYAVGEVVPSYEAWVARVHPDDRAETEAALARARDTRAEYVCEFRSLHPDGSVHWLSARGRFFYAESGAPERMVGAMLEITERRGWEDRQNVLIAELQHRTRNLIGVIRSTSEKTARASVDLPDFRRRFGDRLNALARVQGLLSRLNDVDRVTFDDLVRTELSAMDADLERVMLEGPSGIRLRSSTVQTLAMALHELATNAVKYGALGQPAGHLAINWSIDLAGDGGKPWLHIDWRESGVAMPASGATPQGTGQGRELIEQALPYQLSARTTYTLEGDGVHCTVSIPVSASNEARDRP